MGGRALCRFSWKVPTTVTIYEIWGVLLPLYKSIPPPSYLRPAHDELLTSLGDVVHSLQSMVPIGEVHEISADMA